MNKAKKIFWFRVLLVVISINMIISTLYLISSNIKYNLFNHAYVEAVMPEQNINQTLDTDIVKIKNINPDTIEVNDFIVIYGDYGINVNWVEQVVENDSESTIIVSSYDLVVKTTIEKQDILGVYEKNANFFGMLFYFSSFFKGYALILSFNSIVVFSYYFYLIREKKSYDINSIKNDEGENGNHEKSH